MNGRVRVGRRRPLDFHGRVHRDAERDLLLRAADAGMADADGPAVDDLAKGQRRTVRVGHRPFAAELVEAVALAVSLVAELRGEAARVEVRPPRAVLVDRAAVGKQRAAAIVELRERAERRVLEHHAKEVVRIGRAAGDRHHRLAFEDHRDAGGARRIGIGGRNASPRRAGSDGDDGAGLRSDVVQDIDRGPVSHLAVNAPVFGRDRTLDDADVLAGVILDRVLQRRFRLVAGAGEQRLVIVERHEIENDLGDTRVRRAEERLGAAGALLKVQPHDRRLQPAACRLDDLRRGGRGEADRGRGHRAHPHEVAPRDRVGIERGGGAMHDDSPSG